MKGIVRGVLALALAVAATACTTDETADIGGDFDEVQVDRNAMFVSIGDSTAVLVRLVNDLNSSTPTSFTVGNVGAGIEVHYDATYRPDYTNGDSLVPPVDKPQQRYWVVGNAIGAHQFTLSSSGASTTINVYVTPDNLGAALSKNTGVVPGETLTITAPAGLKFSPTSAVSFTTGSVSVTNRAADGSWISFLVGPGITGPATVTLVQQTYSAAPAVSLQTTQTLTTPAVTTVPLVLNPTAPAAGAVATVTATGFKFLPTFQLSVGGVAAYVVSRSADSLSAQVVLPIGITGPVVVNGVALGFLPSVALTGLTPATALTFPATRPWNGADPDGTAATITAAAPGTEVLFYDTFTNGGPDLIGDGGPNRYYKLVIPSAGSRVVKVTWNNTADLDLFLIDIAFTTILGQSAGSANPESITFNFPGAGTYWIGVVNWSNGPTSVYQISVK